MTYAMDEIAKQIAALAQAAADHNIGPKAVDAVLAAVRVEAISTIVGGVVSIGWALGGLALAHWCWRKYSNVDQYSREAGWIFIAVPLAGLSLVAAAIGIWELVDPWTWVALTHPDLYIAKHFVLK